YSGYLAALVICVPLFVSSIEAQDPTKTLPRSYQTVFENERAQVVHALYEPHQKLPVHDHSKDPTIYVYLSDSGPVRFSHIEEHAFTLDRPPVKMGGFRVSPGRIERHAVENLGDIPSEFLRVELRGFPLGMQDFHYRGNHPFDLSRSSVKTEFSSQGISIERIICVGSGASKAITSGSPSLLIAFSTISVRTSSGSKRLEKGEVYWLDSNRTAGIETADSTTAHALRIIFSGD
ncbi:MAG: hypothetical protein WB992_11115, partial [Bryobacteraceae bacterium]